MSCEEMGAECDSYYSDCSGHWFYTRRNSNPVASGCGENGWVKITPSDEQIRLITELSSNEAWWEMLDCQIIWESTDHPCLDDDECLAGERCERMIQMCVADEGDSECTDDLYDIVKDSGLTWESDACLAMSKQSNRVGVDLCNVLMGPDAPMQMMFDDWTPASSYNGILGLSENVKGRDLCPVRCGNCAWRGEFGQKCVDSNDCADGQFCATQCWTDDCQDDAYRAVCQPCEYCINPWDSMEDSCGRCPPPPPPPMPDKCLVLDETVVESCTAIPASDAAVESANRTVCNFNPTGSEGHAACLASGSRGLYFEAYLQADSPQGFERIRDHESTIGQDDWVPGWAPTHVDPAFVEDVWFENEDDFVDQSPGGFTGRESYVMRWRGTMTVAVTGLYGFRTTSDDGSMLYINSEAVVDNDGDHGDTTVEGFIMLEAEHSYDITIVHYEDGGGNSMRVSWQTPGNTDWVWFGADTSGIAANIRNANRCVCALVSGSGSCKYVAPHNGTDQLEVDYSCKATDESKAGCLGDYTLHWPEDKHEDGNQECRCTANGHTTDHHDRSRRCEFTPGNIFAGIEATCTGSITVCRGDECRWTECQMEHGPPRCKFECHPPAGTCLARDGHSGVMCGDEARCELNYGCWEECEQPCYELHGWEESVELQQCLAECRAEGNACWRRCDACRERENECFANPYNQSSDVAAIWQCDEGCDDLLLASGLPGECHRYDEGICVSHHTGRPICVDEIGSCPEHLPYCNPEGCAADRCTCMESRNRAKYGPQYGFDFVTCDSPCVVGDCDPCCGCDCGAKWDTSSSEENPVAAAASCNTPASVACVGTQPEFLPFLYSDFEETTGVCGSLADDLPEGLGPVGPSTTADDCERWAIASGGTYGGVAPASIYGCYRVPANGIATPAGDHYNAQGAFMDPEAHSPWYFSNTGNGAPGSYSGGVCRGAADTCTVSTACADELAVVSGGRDCCGCRDRGTGPCAHACAEISETCLEEASVCRDAICRRDLCIDNNCAFGCFRYGWCETHTYLSTYEWDNTTVAFDICGRDVNDDNDERAVCDSSGRQMSPPSYECLCAEVGGNQCDLDAETNGTSFCPSGCETRVASPPYNATMVPIVSRITSGVTVLKQVPGCHDPSAQSGETTAATDMGSVAGPPHGAYRFAWRSTDDESGGIHMNAVGFVAQKGCLVVWSGEGDPWEQQNALNAPIRTDTSSVLDLHQYILETPSPNDPSITIGEELQYAERIGQGIGDVRIFDEIRYQEFYVWAQGCPADDTCGRDGTCTCGAPQESPCKVNPIRMDELPEIVCCTDSLLFGRECDDAKCPAAADAVRDGSGNMISAAVPPSTCNHELARCEYDFTTRGQPDFIKPANQEPWHTSPELVFATELAPDHALSLRIPSADYNILYELQTAPASATDAVCPGTTSLFQSDSPYDWQSTNTVPLRYENHGQEPVKIWLTVDAFYSETGRFSLIWQTENMCTFGKTCHDGSCVDARPCDGGWKIGNPSNSDRRTSVEIASPWRTDPTQNVYERFFTPEECLLEVQKQEPNANGATYTKEGRCYAEVDLEVSTDFPSARDVGVAAETGDIAFPAPTWGIRSDGSSDRNAGWISNLRIKGGGDRGVLEMRFAELHQECPLGCTYTPAAMGTDATVEDVEATCTGQLESGAVCAFIDVQPEFRHWGAVCDNKFKDSLDGAKAVCKTLGYETFEEQPEECDPVEAEEPGDVATACQLDPGTIDAARVWQPGKCTRLAGNGRCQYVPKIPASYGYFPASHGDDDFVVDNLECPPGSDSITSCTMSTPYTDTCSDVETIGIDCNVMHARTCAFEQGSEELGCPPTPFALGNANTTCVGLGLAAAMNLEQCKELAILDGAGFGNAAPEDIYGCFRYISPGAPPGSGGSWMYSASGSTEVVCDGSSQFGVSGYECLCAKYDGVKVSDDACTECTENCENNLNYQTAFDECRWGSEETGWMSGHEVYDMVTGETIWRQSIAWDLAQNDTMAEYWTRYLGLSPANQSNAVAHKLEWYLAQGYKVCYVPDNAQRHAYDVCMSVCMNKRACGGPEEDTEICERTEFRYGANQAERCVASAKLLHNGQPQCYWVTRADEAAAGYNKAPQWNPEYQGYSDHYTDDQSNYWANNGECKEEPDWCGDCHRSCFGDELCIATCANTACRRDRVACEECDEACDEIVPKVDEYRWVDAGYTCEQQGFVTIPECPQDIGGRRRTQEGTGGPAGGRTIDSQYPSTGPERCFNTAGPPGTRSACREIFDDTWYHYWYGEDIYEPTMCTCVAGDLRASDACEEQGYNRARCEAQGCCQWDAAIEECKTDLQKAPNEWDVCRTWADEEEIPHPYCNSNTPHICREVRVKDEYDMTLEELMQVDTCRQRCKNDPVCFTPGQGLSWAQDMGGFGRGLEINACDAYKLRTGTSYREKCENSTNAFCYWDSYSENEHCNGGFDCAANRGDCKEEIDYCGDCENWCHQCILDFGAASCTPEDQCLAECRASPDCNRDREVCEQCKEECLPPEKDQCEFTQGDGSTCAAPCVYESGIPRYDQMWWGSITVEEIEIIGEQQCRIVDSCTSTNVTDSTITEGDTINCVLSATVDFGVTPGSCEDVDSNLATCTYVPSTANCAEGSGCHKMLKLALHEGVDVDFIVEAVEEKDSLLEMAAAECPLQWQQCDCHDELESALLDVISSGAEDFFLPGCESGRSEGDCTLSDGLMALLGCLGVFDESEGPGMGDCYDEFGSSIPCDNMGPASEPWAAGDCYDEFGSSIPCDNMGPASEPWAAGDCYDEFGSSIPCDNMGPASEPWAAGDCYDEFGSSIPCDNMGPASEPWAAGDCYDEFGSSIPCDNMGPASEPWAAGDCYDEFGSSIPCDNMGPASEPWAAGDCYDEFGSSIPCDSMGPGTGGRRLQAEHDDCTPVHRCMCDQTAVPHTTSAGLQFDRDIQFG